MDIISNEHSLLNASFRSIPFTLPIILIIIYIYTNNLIFLYLFLGQYLVKLSTIIFKNAIFYPIGLYLSKQYNTIDIPIIGRFKRPEGAKNTGCFYIDDNNFSTSEGMPSGHSMLMAFVCVFLYYYIVDFYNIKNEKRIYLLMFGVVLILYMMYSRVLMNAHTIQQTIIGALIGSVFAYYYYNYVKNKINIKKKIFK